MSTLRDFLFEHEQDDLSLDIETASTGEIIGFAIAWGPGDSTVQWFDKKQLRGVHTLKAMNRYRGFITHYGLFDALCLLDYGCEIRIPYDTYSAARILLWDRRDGFTLIKLAHEFVRMKWWDTVEQLFKDYEVDGMEKLPREIVVAKCKMDAVACWRLAMHFNHMVEDDTKLQHLIRIESQMNHVLAHMRHVGFGFDAKHMAFIKADIKKQMTRLMKNMHRYIPDIELHSNDTLVQQLFSRKGLRINTSGMPLTPVTGRVSVSADIFERYADRHPILGMIAEWKRLDKLLNTYTDTYAEAAAADGRIHSKLDSFGANTGRLSSSSPNMQNIPKTAEGRIIRKAFVSRPGYTLVDIDYSQIQLVILAVFSQDENLMLLFRNGQDMHKRVASALYNKPEPEITGEERNSVKAVNFGMVFGGGRWLFQQWAGADEQLQKQYQDLWYSLFPGVRAFNDKYWSKEMQTRGYNETWMGRRRPLHKLYAGATGSERAGLVRLLCNGDIQGTEGDLLKLGMVSAFNVLYPPEAYMVMCVHDEVVFEVEDLALEGVIMRLQRALQTVDFPIPLRVQVSTGKNWYAMAEYSHN